MPTVLKNKVFTNIGVTPVDVLSTAANVRSTIIGFSLANIQEGIVLIDVKITDDTSTSGYYVKQLVVPPNSSLRLVNGGEKLILAPNNKITIQANLENCLDAIISYVDIT
jgi:hypothetical protein